MNGMNAILPCSLRLVNVPEMVRLSPATAVADALMAATGCAAPRSETLLAAAARPLGAAEAAEKEGDDAAEEAAARAGEAEALSANAMGAREEGVDGGGGGVRAGCWTAGGLDWLADRKSVV